MKVSSFISKDNLILKPEVDQLLGYEAEDFQNALLEGLNDKIICVVVDLSPVNFISSWGIGMLMHGLATTTNRGVAFKIAGVKENIMEVFKKIKIDTVLEIYSSLESALK